MKLSLAYLGSASCNYLFVFSFGQLLRRIEVESIPIGSAHKTVHCAEVRLHHTLIKFNCESHQLARRHLRRLRRLPARGGVTRQRQLGAFFRVLVVRWEREIRVACADLLPGR